MRTPIYQLDAFAGRIFSGNLAVVMPLDRFIDDATLQAIAAEYNLAETAFLVREGRDYRLRWFTPAAEVPLCGHATLASAAVVMERLEPGRREVIFYTASGPLGVTSSTAALRSLVRPESRLIEPLGPEGGQCAMRTSGHGGSSATPLAGRNSD
jgi:PhzF family phenazine biosynthesis protein